MQNTPHEPLSYATPTRPTNRPILSPGLRAGAGFVILMGVVVFAFWFWNNNPRTGPDWFQIAALVIGWLTIALVAGVAFVQLVKGIKAMPIVSD